MIYPKFLATLRFGLLMFCQIAYHRIRDYDCVPNYD